MKVFILVLVLGACVVLPAIAAVSGLDYFTVQQEKQGKLRYRKTETGYVLVLTPGQRIISSLKEFQKLKKIESASVQGIGAVRNTSIGHFNFESATHDEAVFKESHELVSLNCTLGRFEGSSLPHCHIAIGLGKEDGHRVVGGHLNEAEVSIIGEFSITASQSELVRTFDQPFNGKLVDLNQLESVDRTDVQDPIVPTKPE
jgi:predicted DNA-binding protein with PD1-like motif